MTSLKRLPGCICHLQQRSFASYAAAYNIPQASTSKEAAAALQLDHPHDPYNAFVSVTEKTSKTATPNGPLSSLRYSVKDNFATHDDDASATTCSSRMLDSYRSPFEATVVKKLRQHGARIVGKTNMDEFGMGSNGVYSVHGPVKNPLDPTKVAGGSSSGAAASVAAGLCDV